MSRRRRIPPAKPHLESLESRPLFSVGIPEAHLASVAAASARALAQDANFTRHDLDALGRTLVSSPRTAEAMGLNGLGQVLRQDTGYAAAHGWGAAVVVELTAHPAYTSYHHLTGLLTAPALPTTSPTKSSPVSTAPTPAQSATTAPAGPPSTVTAAATRPLIWQSTTGVEVMLNTQPTGGDSLPDSGCGCGSPQPRAYFNSDVGLVTGEYLQNYQTVTHQALGVATGLDFEYSSLQADARPIVEFNVNVPSQYVSGNFQATLTFNGTTTSAITYDITGYSGGTYFRLPLQADATSASSGAYAVTITLTEGGLIRHTDYLYGVLSVVNAASSPFGAGWSVDGLQQVFSGPASNWAIVASGSNTGELFSTSNGASYTGLPGDTTSLVKNNNNTWTRTYTDGTVVSFDTGGREVSQTDRFGNVTTYTYDGSNRLSTVIDPTGQRTTLAYDGNGHLSTVTDPASRVTTFSVDGNGNLTQVTGPDSAVTQYAYSTPSNHRITSEVSPTNHTATVTYDSFGRMSSETLFDGTSTTSVHPAQEVGLVAAGGNTSLTYPSAYQSSVTDPNNHTTTFLFDSQDHVTKVWDAANHPTTYVRDANERITQVTDPLGRTTSYAYDSQGNVTQITRPDSSSMSIGYGVNSQPNHITDYRGLGTTLTLDSVGNVTRRTDPDSGHEDFTYNSAGQVLTDTDRNGNTTSYAYDTYGRLTTITYPGTGTPTVQESYSSAGNATSITDELGHVTSYSYDNLNRVTSVTDPLNHTTSYGYDTSGNLTTVTDPLGHVTTSSYDARNRLTAATDALNHTTSYAYDAGSDLTSVTDPLGHTTSYAYDAVNRLVSVTDPLNHTTSYGYDSAGQLITVTDANNHTTSYAYDSLGRVGTITYPGTGTPTIHFSYDADNNVTAITDALNHTTTYTYNNLNRLTAVTDALSHTVSYGYDSAGNQTTVTDGLGHVTTSTYDARNRLTSVTEPSGGGTTSYAYDAHSRLVSLTDPVSNTTTWGYDAAGRVSTETDPRGKVTTYVYDNGGNLTAVTDRDNRTISYTYDADNRETSETWVNPQGGSPLNLFTYTYDNAGRLTQVQDQSSEYTFGYDADNELTSVDNQGTTGDPHVILTYTYDNVGNRTSLDDSLGGLTSYTYDSRNELTTLTQSGTGVASKRVDFAYDAAGRMTTLTRYSDLAGTNTVIKSLYGYDAADRLTTISHQTAGATVVSSYGYTLDAADRLTSEARTWASGGSSDTVSYTYTNNNQVTGATHTNGSFSNESFSYDANGNRTMSGYSTGAANELSSDGTYNYAYDDQGNLVTRTKISDGSQTLYKYDFRNRLTEVDQVVNGVQTTLATYTYDSLDRRIGVAEGGTTTWTVYDGVSAILDFNGSGTQVARYLQGPAVDEILARETTGSVVAWYLTDRLGTVRDIVDNTGSVIDHVDYGVFGNVVGETNPGNGDRWKFTGREYDILTSFFYYRARYYDAASGVFVSIDPIGFVSNSTNLFMYTNNAPNMHTDPSGNIIPAVLVGGGIGFLTGVGTQLYLHGTDWHSWDLREIARQTLVGGIVGGSAWIIKVLPYLGIAGADLTPEIVAILRYGGVKEILINGPIWTPGQALLGGLCYGAFLDSQPTTPPIAPPPPAMTTPGIPIAAPGGGNSGPPRVPGLYPWWADSPVFYDPINNLLDSFLK